VRRHTLLYPTILLVSLLSRAWPGEVRLNDDVLGEGAMSTPAAVAVGDTTLLVAWVDARRGHRDVFAGVTTADGEALGEVRLVNDDDLLVPQWEPQLARVPGGDVVWCLWRDERSRTRLYVQRLTTQGDPIGINVPVNEGTGAAISGHAIAVSPEGTALVVWSQHVGLSGRDRIYGRLVGPDGMPEGAEPVPLLEEQAGVDELRPAVAWHPLGWVLAWEELQQGQNDVWLRFLDENLQPVGFAIRAGEDPEGDQTHPRILVQPDSSIVLVWKDTRGGQSEPRLQRFNTAPSPLGPSAPVREVLDAPEEREIRVVGDSEGNFAVLWLGYSQGDWIPMGRTFAADATPVAPSAVIDHPEGIVCRDLAAAYVPGRGYAALWVDARTGTALVYLKVLDPSGGVSGLAVPVFHLTPGSAQIFPDVALRDDGTGLAIWVDQRTGSPNLFGQFLDASGRPTGGNVLISAQPMGRFGDPLDLTNVLVSTPKVATSPGGPYLVTWILGTESGRGLALAQMFGADGSLIGDNFYVVPDPGASLQANPVPLVDGPRGLMAVVWQDNTVDEGGDIFLRKFNVSGPVSDPVDLVDLDRRTAPQYHPSASMSPFGDIVTVWTDERNGGPDIYAQFWHTQIDYEVENFLVVGEDVGRNAPQVHADVAMTSEGYVVVWDDDTQGIMRVQGKLIILPSLRPGLAQQEIWLDVSGPANGNVAHWPRVAVSPSGRIVVVWWDRQNGVTKILGRIFEADGTPAGPPFLVTPVREEASRFSPSVDALEDAIQFVYADSRRWLNWDVYTRRESWTFQGDSIPGGTPVLLWGARAEAGPEGIRLAWEAPRDLDPGLFRIHRRGPLLQPGDPRSGALRVFDGVATRGPRLGQYTWRDPETHPGATYAYWIQVVEDGNVRAQVGPLVVGLPLGTPVRFAAYPNPFRERVTFRIPPSGQERTLEIFDPAGRRIWRGRWPAGSDPLEVEWEARLAQGVYWARLRGERTWTLRLLRLR
jgi:hypothetical protein